MTNDSLGTYGLSKWNVSYGDEWFYDAEVINF